MGGGHHPVLEMMMFQNVSEHLILSLLDRYDHMQNIFWIHMLVVEKSQNVPPPITRCPPHNTTGSAYQKQPYEIWCLPLILPYLKT